MTDNFDDRLLEMAQKEKNKRPLPPQGFDEHIETILEELPQKRRRHMSWKAAVILAAALTVMLSATVTAAVNYARQRMEAMDEEEKQKHFQAAQNLSPSDFYSRELTDRENRRMEELRDKYYGEGLFPKGQLKLIEKPSEYDGSGVAHLASRSTFFLPDNELSDEDMLQIIDFREKREFSIHEAENASEAEGWDDASYEAAEKAAEIEGTQQDRIINYSGEMRVAAAAASDEFVFFGDNSQACLYQMKLGSEEPVKMNVKIPDEMKISIMTTDPEGNLYILLVEPVQGSTDKRNSVLWKLSSDGIEFWKTNVTEIGGRKMDYQAMAADSRGMVYLVQRRSMQEEQMVIILNKDGSPAKSIPCPDGDIRGIGRAGDGEVYGVLMDGGDWIPTVVGFDIERGEINRRYADVLPSGLGAFTVAGPGSDSDLLIWGPAGVYSYNIGDREAVCRLAQYELPDAGALCIVPGGRVLFITNDYKINNGAIDFEDYRLDKIYFMKVK